MSEENSIKEMRKLLDESTKVFQNKGAKLKNQECYDKDGNFLGWFSRSTAVVCVIIDGDSDPTVPKIVVGKRGKGCPDYVGYWNLICGYVDFNETIEQSASRETYEECGLRIPPEAWHIDSINSDPNSDKRQNISLRMWAYYKPEYGTFSFENSEQDEVDEIKWVEENDVDNMNWAFNHRELVKKYLEEMKKLVEYI